MRLKNIHFRSFFTQGKMTCAPVIVAPGLPTHTPLGAGDTTAVAHTPRRDTHDMEEAVAASIVG